MSVYICSRGYGKVCLADKTKCKYNIDGKCFEVKFNDKFEPVCTKGNIEKQECNKCGGYLSQETALTCEQCRERLESLSPCDAKEYEEVK